MILYISTTFISDNKTLIDALRLCQKAGINSVEIGSNHCYESNYDYIKDFPFKYLVHNYFPIPRDSFVLNIASIVTNIRARSIQHIKKAIEFCNKIGAELYTFHPGFLTDPHGANLSIKNYDFQWDDTQLNNVNYEQAKMNMYLALDEVVKYAQSRKISIAIETEGSLNKKNHLLMQRPDEYEEFMAKYSSSDIGMNLNIGHLNLAAKAFQFEREDFVDLIKDYIVAMELSHNDGIEDQHLPLQPNSWYWNLIFDPCLENAYKILEFRNTQISGIVKNIHMIQEKENAVSVSK